MSTKKRPRQAIGYGRPPVATRFRKGCSGNPHGRPKGARNRVGRHVEADELVRIMNSPRTPAGTKVKAAKALLEIVTGQAFVDDVEE
jgi:hypothetical protein